MRQTVKKLHVFVVSDATGITAERAISAVLVQFKRIKPIFKRCPYIKTTGQIEDIMETAERLDAIVIYSIVAKELHACIQTENAKRNVEAIDLIGPLLERMQRRLKMTPSFRRGLFKGLGEESLRRAESIDFTLSHDDGQGIETLGKADLIILGVSRTSKTPTSLYLSCNNNLKVANVPLILNVEPPKKIFTLKTRKVGLSISAEKLAFIRQKRLKYAGETEYTDITSIKKELEYSSQIFKKIEGLGVIDVTSRSIEEIADKIL